MPLMGFFTTEYINGQFVKNLDVDDTIPNVGSGKKNDVAGVEVRRRRRRRRGCS